MIGTRDELTERIARRLARESGLPLEWSIDQAGEGIQGLRPAGIDPRHGVLLVLSRTLHRVEAALVAEPYAGRLVRVIGDHIAGDPSEWVALHREAGARGMKVNIDVNGEALGDLAMPPSEPWRSLELECLCRVPRGRSSAEDQLGIAAAMCLAFLVSGLRGVQLGEDEDEDEITGLEGTAKRVVETRYERDPVNRLRCIKFFGARCWVCDFDFSQAYGDLGAGYIVVHHTLPVSKMGPGYRVDPLAEMIPLCPNCHAMVHRVDPPMSPEDLRRLLGKEANAPRPTRVGIAATGVRLPS